MAMPPAAPATAAPPATSGTFALLATLPTVLPALFALPPTALRTASTFECLLEEPFEREAPLLELRGLLLDFGLAFEAFALEADFAFEADLVFGFDDDFAFGFDDDFGFDFDDELVDFDDGELFGFAVDLVFV
jgi:hypothetical protein